MTHSRTFIFTYSDTLAYYLNVVSPLPIHFCIRAGFGAETHITGPLLDLCTPTQYDEHIIEILLSRS